MKAPTPQPPVRALTLRNPWADLVVDGRKRIETRGWQTRYRGWLLIHVSGSRMTPAERAASEDLGAFPVSAHGALIGAAWLMGCVPTESIRDSISARELRSGDYSAGRFAWLLTDARRWSPIDARGALGLWRPDTRLGVEIHPEDGRVSTLR